MSVWRPCRYLCVSFDAHLPRRTPRDQTDLMNRRIGLPFLLLALVALSIGGCASSGSVRMAQIAANVTTMSVQSPVAGSVYADTRGPIAATSLTESAEAPAVGRATAKSVLGLVGVGDASIQAAMENGDITNVWYVDYEAKNYLGIYATFTTIVYGE